MKQVIWFFEDVRDWLKERFKRAWQACTGWWLDKKLAADTTTRSEAEEAVRRVVMTTNIAPDCVTATVVRGGPCILVKHDRATEAIIHNTYAEAADEAIRYILQHQLGTGERSKLNRAQRRQFDAEQRRKRKNTQYLN